MDFFNPGAWYWAGLAVLIALLYLWNVASRRHEVATFWLWQRALARRPAWFRLRFWFSLAAQIVILLLLVAALSEPYWKAAVAGRRTLVLILDVSASMSATDEKPSRLAAAQAEAKRIVQGLQPGERMAILSAGSLVRTVCRLTGEPQTLQAALDSVKPTDGTAHMHEAVELARRLLDGQRNPRIVLLTDACFPDAAALAKQEDIYLKRFGPGGHNRGITNLAARPDPADPKQQVVLIETANDSDSAADCVLEVSTEGGKPQTAKVSLAAGAVTQTTISVPVEQNGPLTARLAAADDLAADNEASGVVAARSPPIVFFVAASQVAPDDAVRAALEAVPTIDLKLVERLPDKLPPHAILVLHRQIPQRLPPCPLLVIAPQGPSDLWDVAGTIRDEACAVTSVRRESPLLTGVRFEDIVVEEAVKLAFKQPAEALVATTSGDPLYSQLDRSEGQVLVLHVDLDREKSDLALRADFSRLVRQAIREFSRTGDRDWYATNTDALAERLLAIDTRHGFVVHDSVGVHPRVSLVSRQETNIRAGADVPSRDVESPAPTREQPLWMLLAAVAVVVLLIEWCLFHRRVVV